MRTKHIKKACAGLWDQVVGGIDNKDTFVLTFTYLLWWENSLLAEFCGVFHYIEIAKDRG